MLKVIYYSTNFDDPDVYHYYKCGPGSLIKPNDVRFGSPPRDHRLCEQCRAMN